jgi:hypothetical protein
MAQFTGLVIGIEVRAWMYDGDWPGGVSVPVKDSRSKLILRTKFHQPNSNDLLVIVTKLKAKYRICAFYFSFPPPCGQSGSGTHYQIRGLISSE